MRKLKINLKRILVILMIFVTLSFFSASSLVHGKSKLPDEGEFYYSGTTEGTYEVTEGIFDWLLNNLAGIIDWILGISTMLIRMVFVGWTVLAERLLTWVLESTMNMNMELGDINSTDVSSNPDSNQNVTVEAIVYGLVPMFDINIFDLSLANNITGTGIDLSKYKCESCDKGIDDCTCSTCDCNLCQLKEHYNQGVQKDANGDPVTNKNAILMVKEAVAQWYYIIRLIAMIAMLIVLIVVGIKMASTNIASDKALYKRMLVDWVVGMIILFSIQYIMIAIISINDSLVEIVREASVKSAEQNTQTVDPENPSFRDNKQTDSSIEISLYEEVRTRAYDPKLTNGLSGMIMYMTLVYFAVRFSLVYLKRYFTIIVLTLMAPGVAVAYAIQKVMTGKSASFSSWLTEYVMNTIIQVVHAIIYSAFVSMALKLALESISGIIIAFVLMNYMLKAEKLFRKIFKMSSSGSLLDEAENAGDPEKWSSALQNAQSMYVAAKPVTGALMKAPLTRAAIGSARLARNTAILGGSLVKKAYDDRREDKIQKEIKKDERYKEYVNQGENGPLTAKQMRQRALMRMRGYDEKRIQDVEEGMAKGGFDAEEEQALREAIYTDQRDLKEGETEENRRKESSKRWEKYDEIRKKNKHYKKATRQTATGVAAAHVGQLLDYNNYFVTQQNADGTNKIVGTIKPEKEVVDRNSLKNIRISGINNSIKQQLSAEKLLGFTEADKKQVKQVMQFTAKGLLGIGSTFIGLGTFVAHPNIGMPLLAAGISQTTTMLGKNKKVIKRSQQLRGNEYLESGFEDTEEEYEEPLRTQRYVFNRFNSGSMLTMQKAMESEVADERETLDRENRERIRTSKPAFVKKLQSNAVKVSDKFKNTKLVQTLTPRPKVSNEPIQEDPVEDKYVLPEIAEDKIATEEMDRVIRTINERSHRVLEDSIFGGIGQKINETSLHHFKQINKQVRQEKKEAVDMISETLKDEFVSIYSDLEGTIEVPIEAPTTSLKERIEEKRALVEKKSEEIKGADDFAKIIEVAILEESAKTEDEIIDIDINSSEMQKAVKTRIEDMLYQRSGLKKGQHAEDVIKNLDGEILNAKARLDKETKPKTPKKVETKTMSIKEILRAAVDAENGEGEKDFIRRLTGYDVDGDVAVMQEVKPSSKKIETQDKSKSEQKAKQDKIVELLLLQKQMRQLNQEAIALKMTPKEANERYEKARTFVYNDRRDPEKPMKLAINTGKDNTVGPVTNVIELINNRK